MTSKQNKKGFTIVELLIVIVVIAILAVITIIAFNGVQQKAKASASQASANQASKKLELYKAEYSAYPLTGSLLAAGVSSNGNTSYQYTSSGTTYCLTATTGGVSVNISDSTAPSSGACAGHSAGGLVVVNLFKDPNMTSTAQLGTYGAASKVLTIGADTPYTGSTYARLTATTAGNIGYVIGRNSAGYSPVSAANSYTVNCYARTSSGFNIATSVLWFDAAFVNISTSPGGSVPGNNSWTRLSYTTTAPASAAFAQVRYLGQTVPVNDTFDLDGCMLSEGSSVYNYADGNSAGWNWSGSPDASSSSGPPV